MEKLEDLMQCNCVTPFKCQFQIQTIGEKKALIRYLINIQSSAKKCILYTEVEVFLSPLHIFHKLLPLIIKFLKQNLFKSKISLYKCGFFPHLYKTFWIWILNPLFLSIFLNINM